MKIFSFRNEAVRRLAQWLAIITLSVLLGGCFIDIPFVPGI